MATPDAELTETLESAQRLAHEFLAPRACQTDRAASFPPEILPRLAELGLLGISVPTEHGGLGASPADLRRTLEIIASGCGTTAFVFFQHLGACRHIAGGENAELAKRLLPELASGTRVCTLAFSHLRRPGPPMLHAVADGDHFVFDGSAPWSTGAGVADDVLIAATTEDGASIWAVVPLEEGKQLHISQPMQLAAANASATVSLECQRLRVGPDQFVKRMTPQQLDADTAGAILFVTSLSLGVAVAAVERVAEAAERSRGVGEYAAELRSEIVQAREAVDTCAARAGEPGFEAEALDARAWCIDLGVRAAHAAVTAAGGAANLLDQPAQRLLREAMLYTLTAQTLGLRLATLERLTSPTRSGRA